MSRVSEAFVTWSLNGSFNIQVLLKNLDIRVIESGFWHPKELFSNGYQVRLLSVRNAYALMTNTEKINLFLKAIVNSPQKLKGFCPFTALGQNGRKGIHFAGSMLLKTTS